MLNKQNATIRSLETRPESRLYLIPGGVQHNVVPDELRATFDVRISPLMNLDEFGRMINQWVQDAGDGVAIDFYQQHLDQVRHFLQV